MANFKLHPQGTVTTTVDKKAGKVVTINSQSIRVLERDLSGNVLRCSGTVTIMDAGSGYAAGCLYIKTDGSIGTTLWVNEGSSSSCDFNAK
jgi:hypothetical protein